MTLEDAGPDPTRAPFDRSRLVLRCLDRHTDNPCDGPVEHRYPLSPTGISYPRCDAHWAERLAIQEGIDRRYPQQQPEDFDPTYAGESWDDDGW